MGFPETDRQAQLQGGDGRELREPTSTSRTETPPAIFADVVVLVDGDGKSRGRSCFVIVSNFSWVGQKDLPGGGFLQSLGIDRVLDLVPLYLRKLP